ncbi:MAG: hypothetical protein QF718_08770 [Phycisphaerales bacterium]|jgi:uncharacterized protein YxeA|nr:hypothetical protein [Phycisphaerales bacterium]
MKGVTIIIILSVVWSIIAGILEKKKAADKKAKLNTKEQPYLKVDSVNVKVESLRRKRTPKQVKEVPKQVTSYKTDGLKSLRGLHKDDCPLPPTVQRQSVLKPSIQLAKMLHNRRNLRTAIVLSEILNKPISKRIK